MLPGNILNTFQKESFLNFTRLFLINEQHHTRLLGCWPSSTYELNLSLVVVQSPSCVWLFVTPWTTACQGSLSLTISQSLPKFKFIAISDVVQPSHLSHPLLLLPLIFPSIRDFSNDLSFLIRWSIYWSFSFSNSPSSEYSSPLRLTGLISLLSKGLSGVFSSTTVQRHQFCGVLPSLQPSSHNHTWPLGRP